MNALNRLIMLVAALLLVAIPVLLLLVAFGVIPTGVVDEYTGYRSGLRALGGLSVSDLGGSAETLARIAGVAVALVVFLVITIGAGAAALVAIGVVVGYFVGKFLDGELDLEEVRARAQGRAQGRDPEKSGTRAQESPYAPSPVASGAGSPSRSTPPRVQ